MPHFATFLFLSAAPAYIDIGCRGRTRRMRGIQLLHVLLALMFMALPSLQAKAADAVSTAPTPPASAGAATVRTEQITGTGGTFPAPVYAKWADTARSAIGVDVTYNAIGSGAGQDQIISRSVDFGASDAPMDDARLSAAKLLQFPTVIGAVVVIVNLPRVRVVAHDATTSGSNRFLSR